MNELFNDSFPIIPLVFCQRKVFIHFNRFLVVKKYIIKLEIWNSLLWFAMHVCVQILIIILVFVYIKKFRLESLKWMFPLLSTLGSQQPALNSTSTYLTKCTFCTASPRIISPNKHSSLLVVRTFHYNSQLHNNKFLWI